MNTINIATTTNPIKPKRKQVKNACVHCQKACKKCDDGRPCKRCIKLGLSDTCRDSDRKERKKGVKRGPYKKRQTNKKILNKPVYPKSTIDINQESSLLLNQVTIPSQIPNRVIDLPQYSPTYSIESDETFSYGYTNLLMDNRSISGNPVLDMTYYYPINEDFYNQKDPFLYNQSQSQPQQSFENFYFDTQDVLQYTTIDSNYSNDNSILNMYYNTLLF